MAFSLYKASIAAIAKIGAILWQEELTYLDIALIQLFENCMDYRMGNTFVGLPVDNNYFHLQSPRSQYNMKPRCFHYEEMQNDCSHGRRFGMDIAGLEPASSLMPETHSTRFGKI